MDYVDFIMYLCTLLKTNYENTITIFWHAADHDAGCLG